MGGVALVAVHRAMAAVGGGRDGGGRRGVRIGHRFGAIAGLADGPLQQLDI